MCMTGSSAETPGPELRRLNLGCGTDAVQGWVNLDGSWGALVACYPWLWRVFNGAAVASASAMQGSWSPICDPRRSQSTTPSNRDVSCGVRFSPHNT
jgi:hypothetical protein